jgi:hypothetical protein
LVHGVGQSTRELRDIRIDGGQTPVYEGLLALIL